MKKQFRSRAWALLLAFALVLSVVPLTSFAAETVSGVNELPKDMVVAKSVYGWATEKAAAKDGKVTVTIMPAGKTEAVTYTTDVVYGISNAMTGASQADAIAARCTKGSFVEICMNAAGQVIDMHRVLLSGLNFDPAKYSGDLTAIGSTVEHRGKDYVDVYNNNATGATGMLTGLSGQMVAYGWLLEKNTSGKTITVGDGNRTTDVFNETYRVADNVKVYNVDNYIKDINDDGNFASTSSSFSALKASTLKDGLIYDTPSNERYQVVVIFDQDYTKYDDAKVVEIYEYTAHENVDNFVGCIPQTVRIGCDLSETTQGNPSPNSASYLVAAEPITVVDGKMWTIGDIEDNCPIFRGGKDDNGGEWLVQFDTGWEKSGYQYMPNIEKVGLDPRDIDMLLVPHGHGDHYGNLFAQWETIVRSGAPAPVVYESYEDTIGFDTHNFPEINGILTDPAVLCIITNWYPNDEWIDLGDGLAMMVTLTPGHSQGTGSAVFQVTVGKGGMKDAHVTAEKNEDGEWVRTVTDYKEGDQIFFVYMGGYGINGLSNISAGFRRTSFVSSLRYLQTVFSTMKTTTGEKADGVYNLAQHTNQYPYTETAYTMLKYNEKNGTNYPFLYFMREGIDEVINFCEKRASAMLYSDYTKQYIDLRKANGDKSPMMEYDGLNIITDITSASIAGMTLEDAGPYKHEGGKVEIELVEGIDVLVMHGYDVFMNKGAVPADAGMMNLAGENGLAEESWNLNKGFSNAKDGFVYDPDAWYVQVAAYVRDEYDGCVHSDTGVNDGIEFVSGPVDAVRGGGWFEIIRTGAMTKAEAEALAATLVPGQSYEVEIMKTGDIVNAGDVMKTFVPTTSVKYDDVAADHWAEEAISYVSRQNLFQGVGNNDFAPSAPMTRAMVATIFHRMAGEPEGSAVLTDVADGTWYSDAASWAVSKGLLIANSSYFTPNANATRESLAYAMYQYAGGTPVSVNRLSSYKDSASISNWAKDAMNWAVFNGFIVGFEDGTLAPQGEITRAEVATLLTRFAPRV